MPARQTAPVKNGDDKQNTPAPTVTLSAPVMQNAITNMQLSTYNKREA